MNRAEPPPVESPCNDICRVDEASGLCLGCARTIDEIAAWGAATDVERRAILALLPERLERLWATGQGVARTIDGERA